MNKKSFIIAIFIVFIVLLGSGSVFAQEVTSDDSSLSLSDNIANDIVQAPATHTISTGSNSSAIQNTINSMNDGDILNFEKGEYTDISIYVNKSITINGNGATLIGYANPSANIPSIINTKTSDGGYGISNAATLYIVNTNNTVISGLTLVGLNSTTYSNAVLYAQNSAKLQIINNTIDGASWGIYIVTCPDGTISNNQIKNQATTGLLNFGSARTLITQNTVTNAKNHGIDVRHGTGPNVQVVNNTVIGAKEGIYLMHSQGHTAKDNTLINCTISSISCYGSSNIQIYDNTMYKSRIGVLLGGGYKNITIGENTFNLDNLPYPPTFVYYVAEADSEYQSSTDIMGTHSDSSSNQVTYTEYTGIESPEAINIDYNTILKETGTPYTVPEGTTNADIQKMITSMNDGDTLKFKENAVYTDICLYVDKNIKIIGNNATLVGYSSRGVNSSNIPEKVWKDYGISQFAVLYVLNNTGAVVSDLNIIGKGADFDKTNVTTTTDEYKSVGIYAESSKNITITGCDVEGSSWGIFLQYSPNAVVTNNKVHNQFTTGIMNFGTGYSIIANNTVTNAVNHGIDVRHGTGPKVTVFNNTISGSKEGIYLMHSQGHNVYNNTILNSKISSITAYGSGNENIFNNTMIGSRIGVLLGGGYYNVTIGENSYNLDFLPFPPTFVTYLAKAESKYQSANNVKGVYSDSKYQIATIIAEDAKTNDVKLNYSATLKDNNGYNLANETLYFDYASETYTATTDNTGVATVTLNLVSGNQTIIIRFEGNDKVGANSIEANIEATNSKLVNLNTPNVTKYYGASDRIVTTLTDSNGKGIANAVVNMTINGVSYKRTTDSNGSASIPAGLNSGVYEVKTTFAGDNNYAQASYISKVEILSTVSANDITKIYRNGTQFRATFFDSEGKTLANGTMVRFNINGVFYNRTTDANGTAQLNINLEQGNYTITSINTETKENAANLVTVLPNMIANEDLTKLYRNETQYVLQVLGEDGNPAGANETVTFNINGVFYNRTTNATGHVQMNINLQPGDYIITAEYKNCRVSNNIHVLPVLSAKDLTMKYRDGSKFNATLVDGQGKAFANQTITFNINGVFYNRTTDANGIARLNINLMSGEYIITSSYNGANIANKITISD